MSMCMTNCTVTKSRTTVRLTPYVCERRVATGPMTAMFQPTATPTPMPPMLDAVHDARA